ncbi:hypothetical protein M408DRAFT_333931 [Serendipita vermifera MAFF 305830]|uniref:Uncharacterized protein n=1 Tax=Serendipita vermifera MAFF 305830 TaxID=933852 RepID=A0A0C3AKJ1_SERVB|nr:hypothetical protein M408DRAFT_333931 [Serendipita vermifera MAFF 305830]
MSSSNGASFEAAFYRYPAEDPENTSPRPFGYTNMSQISRGAPSALAESSNDAVVYGVNSGYNNNGSTIFTQKFLTPSRNPIYFDTSRRNLGLVCGRENDTKYHILNSLLAVSRDKAGQHARNDILCFTAENGSVGIMNTFNALLNDGESGDIVQEGPDAIILAWPSNLASLRALHASSKNVQVFPLVVPPEEINAIHLRYLFEGQFYDSENATIDDYIRAIGAADSLTAAKMYEKWSTNNLVHRLTPYLSWKESGSTSNNSRTSEVPEWMRQISQISIKPESSNRFDSHKISARPKSLLLCVDWTGCAPQEQRMQNVLADVVLSQWQNAIHSVEKGVMNTIVCDNTHHYLFENEKSPFLRTLSRTTYGSPAQSPPKARGSANVNGLGPSDAVTAKPLGLNIILLAESPVTLPNQLYDRMDYLILHRFTSPGWLASLERHFHLSPHPASSRQASSLMDQVIDLDEEHVFLYAPPKPRTTPAATSSPLKESGNPYGNIKGVIQRPKMQASNPTPIPIGRQLTRICLSARDHSHPEDGDKEESFVHGKTHNEAFGVIGGETQQRRKGPITDNENEHAPALGAKASPPSPSPYRDNVNGVIGASTSSKGALSSTFSAWRRGDPNAGADYHQSPQQTQGWSWRENATNGASSFRGFANGGPVTSSMVSPQTPSTAGYHNQHNQQHHQQPSPSTFISLNTASDPIIARPVVGGLPRIPSASSTSGLSFSFSANGMTPSTSSVAIPSSVSTGLATSPISPVGPYFSAGAGAPGAGHGASNGINGGRGIATFSPFAGPNSLKAERDGVSGVFDAVSSPSESSLSRYHVSAGGMPMPMPHSDNNYSRFPHYSGGNDRHARTDTATSTESHGSSSADYVDLSVKGPDNRGPIEFSAQRAAGNKRSYAGVAAPVHQNAMSPQRRDTVVPPPGAMLTGAQGAPSASGQSSASDVLSPSPSSDQAPAPIVYPESFFWPLLDALEKARAQVSTPHNRAQSVRHSVVGQELPQSARQRLGLTFKEYVAAASRQSIVVTGDSGDKAWIAMKDWKYPGKSYNSVWISR